MRAIIIEEERFTEVLDLLRLKALQLKDSNTPERIQCPQNAWNAAVEEVARTLHYHFVRWAQKHGASCTA